MRSLKQIILVIACLTATAFAADRYKVRSTGQAPADLPDARTAAIEDALRQAVEHAAGVKISSITEVKDFRLIEDAIYASTAGLVETYKVLQENPDQDGLYTLRVESVVSRADINTKFEAWKALIKRKGYPRLMVVGSVDKQPFERRLTAEIQGILEKKALTVIDLEMLEENKRRDAQRASQGDLDPLKAALISREAGADYFVSVQIEGTKYTAQQYHGITLYPVDATAIVKVISADTARVIASEVVDGSQKADTTERAMRDVTSTVTAAAIEKALRRVAVNWLNDLDQRGGMQITVKASAFSFERLEAIVKGLRSAPGIKEIIVDATDSQGRSTFRIITNDLAINIAAILKKIDPAIIIKTTDKTSIEISTDAASPPSGGIINSNTAMIAAVSAAGALAAFTAVTIIRTRKS
ncbi:MAG: hypothetical protein FVQ82_08825 [Planctomycetes bacterium]|nr:hypothetical protein [Planctomycetota bacterium]